MEGVAGQELAVSGEHMQVAAQVAMRMQDEQDTLRAEDAFNKLRKQQIDLTSGQQGYMNLKGENAVNQPVLREYGAKFDQTAQGLSDGLDNDFQRKLFMHRAQIAGLELRQGIVHHVSQQSDVYAKNVHDATLQNEIGIAAADPSKTGASIARIDANAANYAARFGLGEDHWKQEQLAARSAIFKGQIGTLIATNPIQAEKYFNTPAVFDSLSPSDRAVLSHQVKAAVMPVYAKMDADGSMPREDVNQVQTTLKLGGEAAAQQVSAITTGKPTRESVEAVAGSGGESLTVTPDVQAGRDRERLTLLRKELADPNNDANDRTMISNEIASTEAKIAAGYGNVIPISSAGGMTRVRDTKEMLGQMIAAGFQRAQERFPNDPVYADQVVQQIKARMSTMVAAQQGIERAAQGRLLTILNGGEDGTGRKPVSIDELFSGNPQARSDYAQLDAMAASGIRSHIQLNAHEAESGTPMRSDPKVMEDLYHRMFLPWGDPNKITSESQFTQYFAKGMNVAGRNFLVGVLKDQQTDAGQRLSDLRNSTLNGLKAQIVKPQLGGLLDPKATEMYNNFVQDTHIREAQLKQQGKDPSLLYDPNSPDYIGKSIGKYQRSPQQVMQDRLEAMRQVGPAAQPALALPKVTNDADFNALKSGTTFIAPDGSTRTKP